MKSVLITGANSYIGNSMKKYLQKYPDDYAVTVKDTLGWNPQPADFYGFDVVFNVAGIAHIKETKENSHLYFDINRDLVIRIARTAKKSGVSQFILVSTMSVYGAVTGHIMKDTPVNPSDSYGRSKAQADETIEKMAGENFKFVCIRPPMIYGKGCKGNYQRLRSFAMTSPIFPDYRNQRSMLYIGNLCEFVKACIDQEKAGLFFPQNADYVNTCEMVRVIAEQHGKKIRLTRAFNWMLKISSVNIVKKVFGNLTYSKEDIVSKYSFEASIRESEWRQTEEKQNYVYDDKYSVLMPLYYKEKTDNLKQSLKSMMTQSLKPDEIVLIEDHPVSDEIKTIIRDLSEEYDVEVNIFSDYELDGKGLPAVLKYGVDKCRNQMIARMDSDDISLPSRCEKEVKILREHPEYAIVGTWVDEFDGTVDNVVTVRSTPENMEAIRRRLKVTNPFNHPTVMFKKDAILASGNYDENVIADEDYDLWYRLIRSGYKGTNIQESLVKYRLGDNFISRRRTKNAFLAKTGIKKQMYHDGFVSALEYFGTMAVEYIYLYCPLDIRKVLFNRDSKRKR